MIVAALIAIGLNVAFAMLRKKTTDIEKMSKIMKESVEFRKQMMAAVKKQDKEQIAELKKKQAYVNKMNLEVQQQQMRPMFIYMIPSLCTRSRGSKRYSLKKNLENLFKIRLNQWGK